VAGWVGFWYKVLRTGFLTLIRDISANIPLALWGREMVKSTLTFELGGQVDIARLEEGVSVFRRLVSALTSRAKVTWIVEDLRPGQRCSHRSR
jgi:hypothetical protein